MFVAPWRWSAASRGTSASASHPLAARNSKQTMDANFGPFLRSLQPRKLLLPFRVKENCAAQVNTENKKQRLPKTQVSEPLAMLAWHSVLGILL